MLLALLFVGVISSEVGVTIVLNSFLLLFSSQVERNEINRLSPLVVNYTANHSFTGKENTIAPVTDELPTEPDNSSMAGLVPGGYTFESTNNLDKVTRLAVRPLLVLQYLTEIGISFFLRRAAALLRPTTTLTQQDRTGAVWRMQTDAGLLAHQIIFTLGQPVRSIL